MAKRTNLWKAGLVLLATLLFSMAASAPSQAGSLTQTAQWYASVYGSQGPVLVIGAPAAQAAQTPTASTGTTTATKTGTGTATPPASTAQASLYEYYLTYHVENQGTATFSPAPTAPAPGTPTATPTITTLPATAPPSSSAIWSGYSSSYSLNADEQQLLGLVNQQRTANHLPAFTVNLRLSYLARLRAREMAATGNLTHFLPVYGTPPQMEEAAGIYGNPMGAENICEGPGVRVDNSALFNSPPTGPTCSIDRKPRSD